MLHACCQLHKLDFALIYTLLKQERKCNPKAFSLSAACFCCQSTCLLSTSFPSSLCACSACLLLPAFFCCLPSFFSCLFLPACLLLLLYTGIYIAEMTSVSNVKGQKRVCKFKYESQQHLSFSSFPPLPLPPSLLHTHNMPLGGKSSMLLKCCCSLKPLPALRLLVRHGKVKLTGLSCAYPYPPPSIYPALLYPPSLLSASLPT